LDHVLIFGEQHLRRVLTLYALYYNETRTHLGLAKDAPRRRAVQRCGRIDSLILTADGEMALTKIKALAETHEAHIAERVGPKRRMQLIDLLRDFG
jgi:hypothetical protein